MRINFLAFLFVLSSLLAGCSSKLTVMSNFYSLKSSYLRSDDKGLDYFTVSSSGSTMSEFQENSKPFILKQLIYEGFIQNGVVVAPVLSQPQLQQKFKARETAFLNRLLNSNGLIKQLNLDKGRSVEGGQLYQLTSTLLIDRTKLELELKQLMNNL